MKREKKKGGRSFFDLTSEERDRDIARFNKPIDFEEDTRPLTRKERALFERARRAGEPHAREIAAFGIDPELAHEAVKYAKRKKMTISQLVEQGLRRELAVRD